MSSTPPARPAVDSPSFDIDSAIEDVSFEYALDDDGNIVRTSKGSLKSNQSTPPTPVEPDDFDSPKDRVIGRNLLQSTVAASTFLDSPVPRRGSLSRSESAYPVLNGPATATSERDRIIAANPARSFHRAASGPVLTIASSTSASSTSNINGASSHATTSADAPLIRFPTLPRRLVTEQQRRKRTTDELSNKLQLLSDYEEKENIGQELSSGGEELYGPRHSTSEVPTSVSPGTGLSRASLPTRAIYGSHSANASRPLGDVQRLLPTTSSSRSKVLKGTGLVPQFGRISEVETEEESDTGLDIYAGYGSSHPSSSTAGDTDVDDPDVPPSRPTRSVGALPINSSQNIRPRRSASLSDALYFEEDNGRQTPQPLPPPRATSRPGTSLGLRREVPVVPPRRPTPEREEDPDLVVTEHVRRRSNSPQDSPYSAHNRRDSDTLRSGIPYQSSLANAVVDPPRKPPTMIERVIPRRLSPSAKNLASSSRVTQDQPELSESRAPLKHRRSPTAPEPGTGSDALRGSSSQGEIGRTWAAGDRDSGGSASGHDVISTAGHVARGAGGEGRSTIRHSKEQGRDSDGYDVPAAGPVVSHHHYHQQQQPQQQQQHNGHRSSRSQQHQQQQQQQPVQRLPPLLHVGMHKNTLVNRVPYAKLDILGKGGSSKVFRVMNNANEIYALKRVVLEKADSETMTGYSNEIQLLKRLEGNNRIIRLIDSEIKRPQNGGRGTLMLVMECGEIDLASLMVERASQPLDMIWVAYYWQQMLEAVQVIHDEKIVHSDLKPANFVLVKGQLKLIDFGIANAIANDTTNIQREHQIGTLNYMSPEAIELPDGMRRLKVGRSSDVWSLGCILYQMVYGRAPFAQYAPLQKMKAIPDPSVIIDFPEYATPLAPGTRSSSPSSSVPRKKLDHLRVKVREDVIDTIKACLVRHPKERITIPDLLKQEWLSMKEKPKQVQRDDVDFLSLMGSEETVINPYYMRQLLQYGIMLGQQSVRDPKGTISLDPDTLLHEGERLVKELKKLQLEEKGKETS
ncbi:Pkinase-domain-containing protein [Dendrothele bispora CBS 962.96]|uniref:Pkinase-domain-containing protein n=1 Tax=Dendrothele bispora (strain CBS 962.96) TaxID=1314807 RepID=A0A4V4HI47_DENBC|nr:Pkinase-domain-containing protein [Dendrothele bispora CBS 962.96]